MWYNRVMNEYTSYTEYQVDAPTARFSIGFEFDPELNNLHVTLDAQNVLDLGFEVYLENPSEIRIEPAISGGVLRIQRETDIDTNLHTFSAGAKFNARSMDDNFEQIRHAQQELKTRFNAMVRDVVDTAELLEIVASTTAPESDFIFGRYVTPRAYSIKTFYTHIAECSGDTDVQVQVLCNGVQIGTVHVSHSNALQSYLTFIDASEYNFNRGDVLELKLGDCPESLTALSVTLIGLFPNFTIV